MVGVQSVILFAFACRTGSSLGNVDRNTPSAFEGRWLAEAVRLREETDGALDDREAVREARRIAADAEGRIVARARHLARRDGMLEAVAAWRPRSRLVLLLLAVLALASGFGVALAVLGDGSRAVNVVWALGGLLGLNMLSLALWFASLGLGGSHGAAGALGRGWLWLSARLSSGRAALHAARALTGLLGRAGLARWWLGAVTHGLWLLALSGALFGLLLTLAARRYGFVWETTILPADVFVYFVDVLGWLPAQIGFSIPDADAVRASGFDVVDDEAGRRAWASWLVGCVLVYGVVPRLLLWALCFTRFQVGCMRLRLDLGVPAYAALAARLAPASERIGVTDAAPHALRHARIDGAHAVGSRGAVLVGLELRSDIVWPPPLPAVVRDAGVIDSREQRRRTVALLAAEPPARVLIACDPRLSPDRGSLELIAELSRHAGACRVWLVAGGVAPDTVRLGYWREALTELGLAADDVFEREDAALAWLEGGGAG